MAKDQMEAWSHFLSKINAKLTYPELITMARSLKGLQRDADMFPGDAAIIRTKIALLGNYNLSFLPSPLEVYLAQHHVQVDLFLGDFANYKQDLLSSDSALYAFCPHIIILLLDHHSIYLWPAMYASHAEVQDVADRQIQVWVALWEKVRGECSASIIQTNIALPCERPLGHYEARTEWSATHYLRKLNQLLAERAPSHVHILDAEHLSGILGKLSWFDEPTWYNTRQSLGFSAVPTLTRSLASMIAALLGKSRKCLVLDLDNTLWGGVVGDVGVEGLRLGKGDAVGEAFIDFQHYIRQLKERGVILAVCSKNNPEIARAPFESHPEMVLKLDDFSAFVANWDDKATNLRRIALQLNVGLDSLVFMDDNPAERALVRRYVAAITVPELPEDPALFRRVLDEGGYFEIATLSKEDLVRTSYYLAERKRQEQAAIAPDVNEFLESLEMVCTCGPFDEMNLQRIVQLINKTNQWNLTTQRLTEGEVGDRMADPSYFTLWVRNRDCFGDNGLIAVLIAREQKATLEVETWLMSCRVINRGIEDFIFNELLDEARRRGTSSVEGTYRPTRKNTIMRLFYENLGFERLVTEEDGTTRWRLHLSRDVCHRPNHIARGGSREDEGRTGEVNSDDSYSDT